MPSNLLTTIVTKKKETPYFVKGGGSQVPLDSHENGYIL